MDDNHFFTSQMASENLSIAKLRKARLITDMQEVIEAQDCHFATEAEVGHQLKDAPNAVLVGAKGTHIVERDGRLGIVTRADASGIAVEWKTWDENTQLGQEQKFFILCPD